MNFIIRRSYDNFCRIYKALLVFKIDFKRFNVLNIYIKVAKKNTCWLWESNPGLWPVRVLSQAWPPTEPHPENELYWIGINYIDYIR